MQLITGCWLECDISCDKETVSMKYFKILRSSPPDIFQEKKKKNIASQFFAHIFLKQADF